VLGREVVSRLVEKGSTVRVMSRLPQRGTINVKWAQAQLLTGKGLSEALQGVDVIVHRLLIVIWQRLILKSHACC
jgi:nucleoside-diphosphate-sugar epimerase